MKYIKYKKSLDYSYTLGAYPTINMVKKIKDRARCVFVKDTVAKDKLAELERVCMDSGVRIEYGANKLVDKLRDKESIDVVGIFNKFEKNLEPDSNHLVLVSPSDLGNLGSILRSAAAFCFDNVAIISPAVDIFHPKLVRSSMGEIFNLNIRYFECFDDYISEFSGREVYPFMLNGKEYLKDVKHPNNKYSLVFGNESSGLSKEFLQYNSVKIQHRQDVDSLNLSNAVSIALYEFYKMSLY